MKLHAISFTKAGFSLSQKISCDSSVFIRDVALSDWVKTHFKKGNCLIFIGAAGIAMRALAPFIKDKKEDPAVIVIDEKGSFVIPLLSGHIGGANETARLIAAKLGAQAVLTPASDVNGLPAIDEFAARKGLIINSMELAKKFAVQMLEYSSDSAKEHEAPSFSVSIHSKNDSLNLIPSWVILGAGCKKGRSAGEFEAFLRQTLDFHKIDIRSIQKIASIDLKKNENAFVSLAESLKIPFVTFSAGELNEISQKVTPSDFVSEITGTDNVCERSVFAAGAEELIVPKTSFNGMTLALGVKRTEIEIPEELQKFYSFQKF